jgi:hypothetical protein
MLLSVVAAFQGDYSLAVQTIGKAREINDNEIHKILRQKVLPIEFRLDFSHFEHINYLILKEYHIFLKL